MWYVYMVECSNGSLYTGATNDVENRLEKHNSGRGALYTKMRSPVKLVYQESCVTKSVALSREYQIKSWPRAKKLVLISSDKSKRIE